LAQVVRVRQPLPASQGQLVVMAQILYLIQLLPQAAAAVAQ
jgi:hypothetical protein